MLWHVDCEIIELVGNRSKDLGIGTFSSYEVFNCSKTKEDVKVLFAYELHSFERLNDPPGCKDVGSSVWVVSIFS